MGVQRDFTRLPTPTIECGVSNRPTQIPDWFSGHANIVAQQLEEHLMKRIFGG
jgi:hypothetical protein